MQPFAVQAKRAEPFWEMRGQTRTNQPCAIRHHFAAPPAPARQRALAQQRDVRLPVPTSVLTDQNRSVLLLFYLLVTVVYPGFGQPGQASQQNSSHFLPSLRIQPSIVIADPCTRIRGAHGDAPISPSPPRLPPPDPQRLRPVGPTAARTHTDGIHLRIARTGRTWCSQCSWRR